MAVKVMCHEGSTANRLNALHEALVAQQVKHKNVVITLCHPGTNNTESVLVLLPPLQCNKFDQAGLPVHTTCMHSPATIAIFWPDQQTTLMQVTELDSSLTRYCGGPCR